MSGEPSASGPAPIVSALDAEAAGDANQPAQDVPVTSSSTDDGTTHVPPVGPSSAGEVSGVAPAVTQANRSQKQPQPPAAVRSAPSQALLDQANEELAFLLTHGKINQSEVMALQKVLRENVTLKEKVGKLKSLLARSAKAQKEAKAELEGTRRRHEEAVGEVRRLTARVDSLASRPTHMDLLADFETNVSRVRSLLSCSCQLTVLAYELRCVLG